MDIYTLFKLAGTIIGTLTVSGAVIWWFVQLGANALAETYKKKVDHEFGKKLENYKSQIEVLKATVLKYNDRQFELYLDLWKNLQDLKFAAIGLWEEATIKNLDKFDIALKAAHRQIETSSILLEDRHYKDLIQVIEKLREFDYGKGRLIAARRRSASAEEVDMLVSVNRVRKNECLKLIDELKDGIKQTVKGQTVTDN